MSEHNYSFGGGPWGHLDDWDEDVRRRYAHSAEAIRRDGHPRWFVLTGLIHLMNERYRKMFQWVRAFNPYDLYTKTDKRPDLGKLLPYYRELVDEFLPGDLQW